MISCAESLSGIDERQAEAGDLAFSAYMDYRAPLLLIQPSAALCGIEPAAFRKQGNFGHRGEFLAGNSCIPGPDTLVLVRKGGLNPHALAGAATSRLCVCQFRHSARRQ